MISTVIPNECMIMRVNMTVNGKNMNASVSPTEIINIKVNE